MRRPEPETDHAKAVRCGECVHFRLVPQADGTKKPTCSGAMAWVIPTPDTFCSWGRSKQEWEMEKRGEVQR